MAARILLLPQHLKWGTSYILKGRRLHSSLDLPLKSKLIHSMHRTSEVDWAGPALLVPARGSRWLACTGCMQRNACFVTINTRVLSVIGMQCNTDSRDRCQQTQKNAACPSCRKIRQSADRNTRGTDGVLDTPSVQQLHKSATHTTQRSRHDAARCTSADGLHHLPLKGHRLDAGPQSPAA